MPIPEGRGPWSNWHGPWARRVPYQTWSRCTFLGRPGPQALAGTPAAAHSQQAHQRLVRRGSRALGGTTTGPAVQPSGLGRKRTHFCSYREQRERQHGQTGQLLPVFRRQNKTLFFSRSWNLLPGWAIGWSFPSSFGTRRCGDQGCPGPLRKSPE